MSRVAIFGGSFNPPHIAHVFACALVLSLDDVDRVLVVPAYKHPFAKTLAPFDDRVAMCELAMAWLPGVEVSRIEGELGGDGRTLRTLESLASRHPDWTLRLVIGGDILAEAPRWFGFDAITTLAPPIVLARPGFDTPAAGPALLPDVSSTQVRSAIRRGAWHEAERLMPRTALEHVRAKGLYASG